jgi:hypothetical protein
MLAEDDGLEKFIEDYKLKLAQEKLELLSIEVTPRKQQVGSMKELDFNRKDCQAATLLVCDHVCVQLTVATCSPAHLKATTNNCVMHICCSPLLITHL